MTDYCPCDECREYEKTRARRYRSENPAAVRFRRKRRLARAAAAVPNPKPRGPWTRDELEVAARSDITTLEKSVMLNRSVSSVGATVKLIREGRWGDIRWGRVGQDT